MLEESDIRMCVKSIFLMAADVKNRAQFRRILNIGRMMLQYVKTRTIY